jgi:hypothetical protein
MVPEEIGFESVNWIALAHSGSRECGDCQPGMDSVLWS